MAGIKKTYKKDNLTVIWQPDLCIHSTNCFKGLSSVFDPSKQPWINVYGASTDEIIDQIHNCPSGALSYELNDDTLNENTNMENKPLIKITSNGPILLNGPVIVQYGDKQETNSSRTIALCRCGQSSKKPYCDGTHSKVQFED
jgi:uncharacterized Fe-S cluster protein YjdI